MTSRVLETTSHITSQKEMNSTPHHTIIQGSIGVKIANNEAFDDGDLNDKEGN